MPYNPDTMPNAVFADLTTILDQIKVWSVNRHTEINTSISGLSTQISALQTLTAEQGKILKGLIDDANDAASALTVRVSTLETKVATLESEQSLMQQESSNLQSKVNELATANAVRFPQS